MKVKIKLGPHDLRDTHLPGETGGGMADAARQMIRKIGVKVAGPKQNKSIGVSKPSKSIKRLEDVEV